MKLRGPKMKNCVRCNEPTLNLASKVCFACQDALVAKLQAETGGGANATPPSTNALGVLGAGLRVEVANCIKCNKSTRTRGAAVHVVGNGLGELISFEVTCPMCYRERR